VLGYGVETVRKWVNQAGIDAGNGRVLRRRTTPRSVGWSKGCGTRRAKQEGAFRNTRSAQSMRDGAAAQLKAENR
jgi:hypothetical protein